MIRCASICSPPLVAVRVKEIGTDRRHRECIAVKLKSQVEERALRQYVSFLAGQAEVQGVDLNAAPTPLVQ